jgi:hypothetical protein
MSLRESPAPNSTLDDHNRNTELVIPLDQQVICTSSHMSCVEPLAPISRHYVIHLHRLYHCPHLFLLFTNDRFEVIVQEADFN